MSERDEARWERTTPWVSSVTITFRVVERLHPRAWYSSLVVMLPLASNMATNSTSRCSAFL